MSSRGLCSFFKVSSKPADLLMLCWRAHCCLLHSTNCYVHFALNILRKTRFGFTFLLVLELAMENKGLIRCYIKQMQKDSSFQRKSSSLLVKYCAVAEWSVKKPKCSFNEPEPGWPSGLRRFPGDSPGPGKAWVQTQAPCGYFCKKEFSFYITLLA